jgi:CDP-glycerol glycerophosphotransferase (TagB/SpsB family)
MDAITACRGSTFWIFKFHPADQSKEERVKYIESCFDKHGEKNYDLTSANHAALNIYDCIEVVDSVISSFSSSLLEAMMLRKTPVIIHPEGEVHYQNYIDNGSMLLKSNKQDFVKYFNTLGKIDSVINNRLDPENLEEIINQIFTPKAK